MINAALAKSGSNLAMADYAHLSPNLQHGTPVILFGLASSELNGVTGTLHAPARVQEGAPRWLVACPTRPGRPYRIPTTNLFKTAEPQQSPSTPAASVLRAHQHADASRPALDDRHLAYFFQQASLSDADHARILRAKTPVALPPQPCADCGAALRQTYGVIFCLDCLYAPHEASVRMVTAGTAPTDESKDPDAETAKSAPIDDDESDTEDDGSDTEVDPSTPDPHPLIGARTFSGVVTEYLGPPGPINPYVPLVKITSYHPHPWLVQTFTLNDLMSNLLRDFTLILRGPSSTQTLPGNPAKDPTLHPPVTLYLSHPIPGCLLKPSFANESDDPFCTANWFDATYGFTTAAEPADDLESDAETEPSDENEYITAAEPADKLEYDTGTAPGDKNEHIAAAEPADELEDDAGTAPGDQNEHIAAAEPADELEDDAATAPGDETRHL